MALYVISNWCPELAQVSLGSVLMCGNPNMNFACHGILQQDCCTNGFSELVSQVYCSLAFKQYKMEQNVEASKAKKVFFTDKNT